MSTRRLPHELIGAPPFVPEQLEFLAYGRIAEEIEGCLAAGLQPNLGMLIAKFPEFEQQVRDLFPTLCVLYDLGHEEPAFEFSAAAGEPFRLPSLGEFRIVREIGRGGMGVVYEAEQLMARRRVALKVLPQAALIDPRRLQRFRNEAFAAATLEHPHIVPVYSVGCDGGVHYYAMQFIDGRNLAQLIREAAKARSASTGEPRMPLFAPQAPERFRSVAELGIQAADALDYAHQRGVVHRDIKPSNLMIDLAGKVWITDFGLARLSDEGDAAASGSLVGTLRYMSPEQLSDGPAAVDHRADIYALGATLYELLTLRPMLPDNRRRQVQEFHRGGTVTPLRAIDPAIPPELEEIVLKAAARDPADRYQTAQHLASALRDFLNQASPSARASDLQTAVQSACSAGAGCSAGGGPAITFSEGSAALVPQRPSVHEPCRRPRVPAAMAVAILLGVPLLFSGWRLLKRLDEPVQLPAASQANEFSLADHLRPLPPGTIVRDSPARRSVGAALAEDEPAVAHRPRTRDLRDLPAVAPSADQPAIASRFIEQPGPEWYVSATEPPPPHFRLQSDREAYLRHVRALLELAGGPGLPELELARAHFAAAARLCATDPRLDYALGLALARGLQHDEAERRWRISAQEKPYPYLPAWKQLVARKISARDYLGGVELLVQLASVVEQPHPVWPDADSRIESARWIGKTAEVLHLLTEQTNSSAVLEEYTRLLAEQLTGVRGAAFAAGRQIARQNVTELLAAEAETRRQMEALRDRAAQVERRQLADSRQSVRDRQVELHRTAEEWQAWLTAETKRIEAELQTLEKQYAGLEKQAAALSNSIVALEQELLRLAQEELEHQLRHPFRALPVVADQRPVFPHGLPSEQLAHSRQEFEGVVRQAAVVRARAAELLAARDRAVEQFRRATGQLVKQSEELTRWEQRLAQQSQKLASDSTPAKALEYRNRLIRAYFRLDPQREAERILASYGDEG